MKVLILADNFGTGGGAGEIARVQAENLAKDNEVIVLTANAPEAKAPEIYKIYTFDLNYSPSWRTCLGIYHRKAVKILQNHIAAIRPDICYAHNINVNWSYYSLKVLAKAGVKTILTFHDVTAVTPYVKLCKIPYRREGEKYIFDYHYSLWQELRAAKWFYNPLRRRLVKKYVSQAFQTRAVSQALADFLRANKIRVDKVEYNRLPMSSELSREHGPSLFFGGRLSSSKGALIAVRYLAVLKDKYKLTPRLLVAGNEGVVTQKMRILAKDLGVAEQIDFLGWLGKREYEAALGTCGVVIVPSLCFDSFPTIILEAMRAARPVVATIFGGAVEMVAEGQTGFIRDPYDVPSFSGAIAQILSNSELAARMGEAGRSGFLKEFCLT